MSRSSGFWTSIVRYVKALEGLDDPVGDYMFSLGRRVDKLERDLENLKTHFSSHREEFKTPDSLTR